MWAAIILALLSYFASKKSGASDKKALLTAAGVGAGTYYVATETEWGKENLNWFESDKDTGGSATGPEVKSGDSVVTKPNGGALQSVVGGTADVLKSWGGTGTAAVIGTTAVATNSSLQKYLPWLLIGGAVLILTR